MRRPLATMGLFFIFLLMIIQLIFPSEPADYNRFDGDTVSVTGTLSRVEYKKKDDQIRTIWYLSDVVTGIDAGQSTDIKAGISIESKSQILCYMDSEAGNIGHSSPFTGTEASVDMLPEGGLSNAVPLGTTVTVCGRIRPFSPPTNPGQFDMPRYYDMSHIVFALTGASLLSSDTSHLTPIWRLRDRLSHIRTNIGLLCDMCMDEDDSSVVRAMLLGDKSAMNPDTKSLYSRNGIAHILAISGLHISMLGMGLVTVMKKLRIPVALSAGTAIVLMIMYGMMTGMAASAARAIIMFSLRMLADIVHRTYDMATALVIAAVLVLIEQPAYLFYSGFQFSFGAITAVILILPLLEDVFPHLLSGCISINIVTLPVYLWNYYYYPLISVVLNLYIIPLMSVLLGCAIIAVAGCALYIPLGRIFAIPVHLILAVYEWSCRISDLLPVNRYVSGKPDLVNIILYAVVVSLILFFRRYQTRLQVMMHLVFACIMLTLHLQSGVDITLIDVGQGDGIHITDNCGADILIDGGSSDVTDVGTYRIGPYLYSQGVSEVDAAFITHLDADHYNGILEMLIDGGVSMPHIDTLYLTSSSVIMGGEAYDALVEAAGAGHTEIRTVTAGDEFRTGALTFTCLYPDDSCHGEDTNNESLVLDMEYAPGQHMHRALETGAYDDRAEFGAIHILFTGDLGGDGETALTEKIGQYIQPDDYLILKCAHHGSKNSTYEPFLDTAGPDLVLISAGHDNSYGHPNTETLERLDKRNIPHYCTIDHGALDVHITGNDIEVIPYLKPE
ncbi:MAG: DNA internalization-related competence protein ComEC/Rec2 [Lachnospiraceae bacterium]|nr:DNA internalization-related competence protein ComEC/Rec2 [Lachnospiraceae bacterium]